MAGPNQRPEVAPDDLPGRAGVDWSTMADDTENLSSEELETVDELTDFDDEADDTGDDNDDNPQQVSDEALPDDEEEEALEDYNRREAGNSY